MLLFVCIVISLDCISSSSSSCSSNIDINSTVNIDINNTNNCRTILQFGYYLQGSRAARS